MTACHRDAEGYRLTEHQSTCRDRDCPGCIECTHDDTGTPVRHCEARWRCTSHLDSGEYACPRCLNMIRRNLVAILTSYAAMPPEAEEAGLTSGALAYALPSAQPDGFRVRQLHNHSLGIEGEDYDQQDAWAMLGARERGIRSLLGHDTRITTSLSLAATCQYLGWVLTDLARDQDHLPLVRDLLTETSRLRTHLEAVLRNSHGPERGAPCPRCPAPIGDAGPRPPRLQRRYAHWCTRDDCTREHDRSGARDTWQCPANPDHWWTEADYRLWVSDDYLANATKLTAEQIETQHNVKAGTIRAWASKDLVRRRGKDQRGRTLYDVRDTLTQKMRAGSATA